MRHPAAVALDAYMMPLLSTRAARIGILLFVLMLLLIGGMAVVAAMLGQRLPEDFIGKAMGGTREFFFIPGLPIAALLFSEIPIRDGLRQRTLLYSLLTRVPRSTLAVTRTLATGVLLGVGGFVLVLATRLVDGSSLAPLPREALAQMWSGLAFVSAFGLGHLYSKRGLFVGLGFMFLDGALARVPFEIRKCSLTYHIRVLADLRVDMELPVSITPPPDSFFLSATVPVFLCVLFTAVTAWRFRVKNLPELC